MLTSSKIPDFRLLEMSECGILNCDVKVKVRVLLSVQQPGLYSDRSSTLPFVRLKPTEVTAYD